MAISWPTCDTEFRSKRGGCSRVWFSSSNEELSPVVSRTSRLATIRNESSSNQVSSQPNASKSSVPWFPSILLANIRSLRYKMDELQAVVDVNLPDIVCLAETWLNPSIGDSLISLMISGYWSYRCDRSVGWGDVCVYVNSQIPSKRILSYESSEIESLWLEIRPFRLPRGLSCMLMGVVYHSSNNRAAENYI